MDILERMLREECPTPRDLPLSLLKAITEDFSESMRIGSGGFAVVYKGLLANGSGTVAVKKLSQELDMDEKKFHTEVSCLMKVSHKNIVQFLGYCADTQGKMCKYEGKSIMADVRHRLLCFEYLPKGGLDKYITDPSHGLDWRKRYEIIKGICDGLCYLHKNCIVHVDLKPANILLDDNFVPKIADFGLSRVFDEKQSRVFASKVCGTMGYLAPEVLKKQITFKSDIYSLGVIFLEILTGEKDDNLEVEDVVENWRNRLGTSATSTLLEQVRVCMNIALDCMSLESAKRPDMQCIIKMLDKTENRPPAKLRQRSPYVRQSSIMETCTESIGSDSETGSYYGHGSNDEEREEEEGPSMPPPAPRMLPPPLRSLVTTMHQRQDGRLLVPAFRVPSRVRVQRRGGRLLLFCANTVGRAADELGKSPPSTWPSSTNCAGHTLT